MNMKILALLGLVAVVSAKGSIKSRLAQTTVGTHNEGGEGEHPVVAPAPCDCVLASPGEGFTPGQAVLVGFAAGTSITQGSDIVTVPDIMTASNCESNCCACNSANSARTVSGTRARVFHIGGDITIGE